MIFFWFTSLRRAVTFGAASDGDDDARPERVFSRMLRRTRRRAFGRVRGRCIGGVDVVGVGIGRRQWRRTGERTTARSGARRGAVRRAAEYGVLWTVHERGGGD